MFFSGAVLALSLVPLVAGDNWKVIWQDEFNGNELDHSTWAYDVGCNGWGNNERECYTFRKTDNVRVENGHLVIEARVDPATAYGFSSGRIKTRMGWTYGRFEAKAKLPAGYQLWPAIWMLPVDSEYGGWAASGEIDIMESRGNDPHTFSGAIHYGGEWPHNIYSTTGDKTHPEIDFSKDFHIFGLDWSPEKMVWTLDGVAFHEENINKMMWSSRGVNPYTHNGQPFDRPFHFMVNLAIGGQFFGPGP